MLSHSSSLLSAGRPAEVIPAGGGMHRKMPDRISAPNERPRRTARTVDRLPGTTLSDTRTAAP